MHDLDEHAIQLRIRNETEIIQLTKTNRNIKWCGLMTNKMKISVLYNESPFVRVINYRRFVLDRKLFYTLYTYMFNIHNLKI